jgi:PAS domain S-box-containing protein
MRALIQVKTALTISFLLVSLASLAAPCSAERLPVKVFTSADSLGSSYISTLMRDSRGFLWFCTRDGLTRFDGSRFVTYQIGGKNAPPGIEQILETSKGIYWIITTGGLYRFDPNAPVVEQTKSNQPMLNAEFMGNQRGLLFEDRRGNLWFGSDALYRMAEKDGKVSFEKIELNLPATRAVVINAICDGKDGSLWLATNQGLLRRLADGREILYGLAGSRNDPITSILADASGRLWIGMSSGIYVLQPEAATEFSSLTRFSFRPLDVAKLAHATGERSSQLPTRAGDVSKCTGFPQTSFYKYLYETTDGHVWISAGDGVVEFDGAAFHQFTAAQGMLKGVGAMVEDANGNLWFGWATGLMRLNRRGLSTYDFTDGMKTTSVVDFSQRGTGSLYAVTSDFFLSQFDGKEFETVQMPVPSGSRAFWTANPIFQDHLGEWWLPTTNKLYHFPAVTKLAALAQQRPLGIYGANDGLKSDQTFHVFEDAQGDVWVSTLGGPAAAAGLSRWNRATQKFNTFSTSEGFPDGKSVCSFAEDQYGNVWTGFYEGGLARYAQGRFVEFTTGDGLPNGVITALHVDQRGRLWIASALGGLSRVDDPAAAPLTFVNYTTDNGLASNNVRALTDDLLGNVYAGTARGVDRLSADAIRIKHYSVSDGLAGDFVTAAFRDRDGALWFGTPSGPSRLAPEAERQTAAPAVLFGGLRVAGENRALPELGRADIPPFYLLHAQNNLQIDFFAIDFNAGEGLRYQYKLEGADSDWSAPTTQRTVNFANLQPGTYRFLVRAVSADGLAGQTPSLLSFHILPPFWRRWWFVTGLLLLVVAGVFALERYRARSRRTLRESETRFRTLAETASDAIITIDEESRILFINTEAEKVFGHSIAEMVGAELTMLMPEYLRHLHRAGFNRYLETGQRHIGWTAVELPGLHKSGREIPLEVSFGEFTRNGRRYFTGIARDITERKQAAAALEHAREERLRELERVRKRIATDLHDDIGSALTQISILSEVANRQLPAGAGAAAPLALIADSSRELVDSMSDIVWAINPKKDHLSDLVGRMRRFAADVLSARGIEFVFRAPDSDHDVQLGANIRREVFLICKESINNLVKHSACDRADIEFAVDADHLMLTISDNGKGFETAAESDGHGLLSMCDRAAGLGAEFEMSSQSGGGTTIKLDVPLTGPAQAV